MSAYTWLSHHSTELGEPEARRDLQAAFDAASGVRARDLNGWPSSNGVVPTPDCAPSYGPRMGADDVVVVQQNEMENETVVFQGARGVCR